MSLTNFRTFERAVEFHRACKGLRLPAYLKNQLLRAASSTALNLAEGSGREYRKDRKRFYNIALGSHRECQAVLILSDGVSAELTQLADHLGACLYKLNRSNQDKPS